MRFHLTLKSTNKKTGPIPVSTTSEDTCPRSCPWFGKGCYANFGPLRLHWRKISDGSRGRVFSEFLQQLSSLPQDILWRHNQAGDLPGIGERINARLLKRLVVANDSRRGFTYTHKPVEGTSQTATRNREAIANANKQGFTINLSADGLDHADRLVKLGIAPVTTIIRSDNTLRSFYSKAGNKVVVCPATYEDDLSDITCKTCELCAIPTRRSIIGFPAHGSHKKRVDAALQVLQ